jgi:hypothetical protein
MSQELSLLDDLWLTRRRALELGFTHEGTHAGVPVYVRDPDGDLEAVAKSIFLEWMLSIHSLMVQFANQYRAPGDEILFGFHIRPIPRADDAEKGGETRP